MSRVLAISNHIKGLLADLGDCPELGTVYNPLAYAGKVFLEETARVLDEYFITADIDKLNRGIILAGMDFTLRWESWINGLHASQLKHPATKTFHQFLLRFAKGALKSHRCWRIDLQK